MFYITTSVLQAYKFATKDKNSRLNDNGIKKLIFLLTDGKQTQNLDNLKKVSNALKALPVSVYAIASTRNCDKKQLIQAASKPEYVRIYDSMDLFRSDAADILMDTCNILPSVDVQPDSDKGKGGKVVYEDFGLKGMQVGDWRYFQIKHNKAKVTTIKIMPATLNIVALASFSVQKPNLANYDFRDDCAAGKVCKLVVKDPSNFLEDVCKSGFSCFPATVTFQIEFY